MLASDTVTYRADRMYYCDRSLNWINNAHGVSQTNQNRICLIICLSPHWELSGHFVNALMPPPSPSHRLWLTLTKWFVCVCVHSLSCLIHCASFSSLTQFLTYLRNEKTSLSTTLCTPLPSNLPILLPFRSGSRRPWTGSPGAHPWVQGERFYHRAAAQWWSVAEPASMDNLFSYCICISCLWDFCS